MATAEEFLGTYPELRPFVLSNVRVTGIRIGAGAYGSVEEVAVPGAICAAKKIHDILLDRSEIPAAEIRRASAQFVKECQLMSTLRHQNVVRFLGVCFFPGSRLPALVMERLLTSLHDLLDPETDPPLPPNAPKPLFPLSLKCSILHNVACGLAYLHERSPPVIHRDLTARNILLDSGMVAKIVDLGVARIMPRMRAPATMTKGPGASVYMPPEAIAPAASNSEKSKYDSSIDIFSFGVVTVFTVGETFPCDPLAPNYPDEQSGVLVARTELQRRSSYLRDVNEQLRACGQLRGDHPLVRLIEQCLHNSPGRRPGISEVLRLLDEARAGTGDRGWEQVRARQTQPRDQSMEWDLQKLQEELQFRNQENAKLQQRLESSEMEKQKVVQQLQAEVRRAEEATRREQQQAQEMKQRERELVRAKDREVAEAQQLLRQKEERLQVSEALVAEFQRNRQQKDTELETLKRETPPGRSRAVAPQSVAPAVVPESGKSRKLSVVCCPKQKAPLRMLRGSAASDSRYAYFTPYESRLLYRYEWSTGKWDEITPCHTYDSGLVYSYGELVSVSGESLLRSLALQGGRWVEKYPPLKTARSSPAVVDTGSGYVFVIGGCIAGEHWTVAVDLFEVNSRKWYRVTDLPEPLMAPSVAMCGDVIHVIGYGARGYSCSLQALPQSGQRIAPPLIAWKALPALPVTYSTAASLGGQLVVVGGRRGTSPVKSIHQLVEGQWVEICSMVSERERCLVVNSSPNKILIVSGVRAWDNVEECSVV